MWGHLTGTQFNATQLSVGLGSAGRPGGTFQASGHAHGAVASFVLSKVSAVTFISMGSCAAFARARTWQAHSRQQLSPWRLPRGPSKAARGHK